MDHDAMLTHVNKLKQFRDDFLTMSDTTAEKLHEMAERVRAGESRHDVVRSVEKPEDAPSIMEDADKSLNDQDQNGSDTDKRDVGIVAPDAINPLTGLPVGSQDGEKPELVGMQGDPIKPTDGAINPV